MAGLDMAEQEMDEDISQEVEMEAEELPEHLQTLYISTAQGLSVSPIQQQLKSAAVLPGWCLCKTQAGLGDVHRHFQWNQRSLWSSCACEGATNSVGFKEEEWKGLKEQLEAWFDLLHPLRLHQKYWMALAQKEKKDPIQ